LNPHSLLVLWSWKSRAIALLPLWAVRPAQSLSACTRVHFTLPFTKRLRWSRPLVPKFAGSHPARAVGFLGQKIRNTPSFGGEVKPSAPCCSFTACKRSLNVTCKSAFRQNSRTFLANSSTFRRWVLSHGDTRGDSCWRKL